MGCRLDWAGCSTFRLRVRDSVVFLDAYLERVPDAERSGFEIDQVARADWMLIGHSHFDHLWGADQIALKTGASVIGSYETVRILSDLGVPDAQLLPVAGGERIQLATDLTVAVFPSLHSCVWSHTKMPSADECLFGDLGVLWHEREARLSSLTPYLRGLPAQVVEHLRRCHSGERGDGGALLFLIDTGDGTLLFQDSSGAWTSMLAQIRPDVAILAAAGRANQDGEPMQGRLADFIAYEAALLRPKKVILCHHDDWLPGFSTPTDLAPIREAVHLAAPGSELVDIGYMSGYELFDRNPRVDVEVMFK